MSLLQHLQGIPDPRIERTRRHELQSILAVALCATIAGADNWVEVAEFGEQHQDWFARFVPLPCALPRTILLRGCFACSMPGSWSWPASSG